MVAEDLSVVKGKCPGTKFGSYKKEYSLLSQNYPPGKALSGTLVGFEGYLSYLGSKKRRA